MLLWNTNGNGSVITSGVFGSFHLAGTGTWDYKQLNYVSNQETTQKEEPKTLHLRPCDIPFFQGQETAFLAVSFFSQIVHELPSSKSAMALILEHLGSEVVTVYPIVHQVVVTRGGTSTCLDMIPLGLEGRINGAGSVLNIETAGSSMRLKVRGCGTLLVAVRRAKKIGHNEGNLADNVEMSVEINGKKVDAHYSVADSNRPPSASEAELLHGRERLGKNLSENGFDLLVMNTPDAAL
jgi:hypothetical protein